MIVDQWIYGYPILKQTNICPSSHPPVFFFLAPSHDSPWWIALGGSSHHLEDLLLGGSSHLVNGL